MPFFRPRPRTLIAAAVVAALLLGLAGGVFYAFTNVRHQATELEASLLNHLQRGQADLEEAKVALKQANSTRSDALIDKANIDFISAKLEFLSAMEIADGSELLSQLQGLPSIGETVRSRRAAVDSVSAMGIDLATAGLSLAALDRSIIQRTGGQGGKSLLSMLSLVVANIAPIKAQLSRALADAESVDLSILPDAQRASFIHGESQISQVLDALDQFQKLVPVLNEALGGNGARTILLEQVNPAELRPGGGFIGTYSLLKADHGALSLIGSGDSYSLADPRPSQGEPGYVAPPPQFEELLPGVSWSFIDSNFYPDFPSNAQQGAKFASPRLRMHIDAVIAIDYYTVAQLLGIIGPIQVPGYGITLTSTNFVPTVAEYDLNQLIDPNANAIHKAILGAVAGPLLQHLVSLPPGQWPGVVAALNDLAARRHLQVYFNDPTVENTMVRYGWAGVLKPTAAPDYMMEVEANLGGTKANYFVTRTYSVELTRNGNTLHHKVSVDITDAMPYTYRPNEYYRAYIRMFVSSKATAMSSDLSYPHYKTPAPPPGTKMIDGWVQFHGYGHDRVVTFQWDTPWQANGRGVEQIYWQKQPGTINDAVTVSWHDGNGHTYKVSGDLSQDRVITLAPSGVSLAQGQVGTAQLPSLSLG